MLYFSKFRILLIIIFSALNIALSSFFVLSLNLNVTGVALGTLISSYIAMIISFIFTHDFITKKFQIFNICSDDPIDLNKLVENKTYKQW